MICEHCRSEVYITNDGKGHHPERCRDVLRIKFDKVVALMMQVATHTTCSRRACADAEHWVQLSDAAKHLLIDLGEI